MKVVAIGHQKKVGKNTFATFCAEILRERARGANIQVVNIANCLKDAAYMMFSGSGLETWHYYEEFPEKKDQSLANGKTPRRIWLDMGSIMMAYDDICFVRQAMSSAKCDFLFLPDLRRKREVEFLSDYTTHFLKIQRGPDVRFGDIDDELIGHTFTSTIDNDGTLKDLYTKAELFVTEHLYKRPNVPTADLTGGKMPGVDKRY